MKYIDMNTWKGKKHFDWFRAYSNPYYNLNSNIDITKFYKYIKANNLPFFASFMYLVVTALNEIEEFRLRIIDGKVVLCDSVSPAFTVMTKEGSYDNCEVEMYYTDSSKINFKDYLIDVLKRIENVENGVVDTPKSYHEQDRQDQYYITSLPWITLTSTTHPMTDNLDDAVPRIGWSKYYWNNECLIINLGIQVNHCLVDGYPCSLGFLKIQEYVNNPELYLK